MPSPPSSRRCRRCRTRCRNPNRRRRTRRMEMPPLAEIRRRVAAKSRTAARITNRRVRFMCQRRKTRSHCGYPALALLLAMGLAFAPSAAKAELYGLVVGIDDYLLPVNHLDGAANDARDIAQSLEQAGAKEVVRLLNDEARKDRIVSEWNRIVAEAKPGDTFIFSYAGHGGQEPAPPDRHDKTTIESFILGHFEPSGPGTRERIVDDEVNAWLQQADKKGIKVIFVAD